MAGGRSGVAPGLGRAAVGGLELALKCYSELTLLYQEMLCLSPRLNEGRIDVGEGGGR